MRRVLVNAAIDRRRLLRRRGEHGEGDDLTAWYSYAGTVQSPHLVRPQTFGDP